MPQDNSDDKAPALVGRTYSGETSPPITTPRAATEVRDRRAGYASKEGAVPLNVYFASRGIDNPILKASMASYTDIHLATLDDFDKIFRQHHESAADPGDVKTTGAQGKETL